MTAESMQPMKPPPPIHPMKLDLAEVLHKPGMRVTYNVDMPCTPELEVACTSPVIGQLVFTNTGNLLVIQGQLEVTMRSDCPRCLTDVESRVQAEVDDEFTIDHDQVVGRADDEDGVVDPTVAFLFEAGYLLNLTELVRQSILLATPVEPLCREDCAGLCPQCGANRNETTCSCEAPVNSPFAALATLYETDEASSPDQG